MKKATTNTTNKKENTMNNTTAKNPVSEAEISLKEKKEAFKKQCELWADTEKATITQEIFDLYTKIIASTSDSKPALEFVYSSGKDLVATNGKILAIIATNYPAGFYKPAVIGKGKQKQLLFVPVFANVNYPEYTTITNQETENFDSFEVNFKKDNPLYPELFMMNYTLAVKCNGITLADEIVDYVIDTFGKYDLYYNKKTNATFFKNENIKIFVAGCTGAGKILKTINQYKQIAAPAEEPAPEAVKAEPVEAVKPERKVQNSITPNGSKVKTIVKKYAKKPMK